MLCVRHIHIDHGQDHENKGLQDDDQDMKDGPNPLQQGTKQGPENTAKTGKIADRIAMLYQGKIVWHGPVSEIDNSGNAFVEQFINGRADGPIQMQLKAS